MLHIFTVEIAKHEDKNTILCSTGNKLDLSFWNFYKFCLKNSVKIRLKEAISRVVDPTQLIFLKRCSSVLTAKRSSLADAYLPDRLANAPKW